MKLSMLYKYAGMAIGFLGVLFIFLGIIGFLVHGPLLGVQNFYNWFYFGNSFLFVGIFCLVLKSTSDCKKE
jgi:hypothetical protein